MFVVTDAKPKPPAGLAVRGRRFWRVTIDTYDMTDSEESLLIEACRLMDECEQLRGVVDEQGMTVTGSTGQTRVNPAVGELRQHRLALAKLLSQLALPDVDDGHLATPLQARAPTAATVRWAGHVRRGASRGSA